MAGPDARDGDSLPEPGGVFLGSLERDFAGTRLAWSERLGRYPVEPVVTSVCNSVRHHFAALGCEVADAEPDLGGVDEAFQTLRAAGYAAGHGRDLERQRTLLKDTVVWNIERGLALTPDDIARAAAAQVGLAARVVEFFDCYDFLVLPVVQVPPFAVETEWVRAIDGVEMHTYVDWMATCYAVSCMGVPAISVPCGFTPDGLPIGLQIVGGPRRDRAVLELARAFERRTEFALRRPVVA
jgi:amidase